MFDADTYAEGIVGAASGPAVAALVERINETVAALREDDLEEMCTDWLALRDALLAAPEPPSRKPHVRVEQALMFGLIEENGPMAAADVAIACDVHLSTATRKLDGLVAQGKLTLTEGVYAIADPLGDPPAHLADAWERFQLGGAAGVTTTEMRYLDEWREAREAY